MQLFLLRAAFSRALRDWRLAEVRLLFLALSIAVLAVTSISFFTDRVERAMQQQGTALLGGDLLVRSSRPIGNEITQLLTSYSTAAITEFRSVVLAADKSLLTEVKAVASGYPLRGAIETSLKLSEMGSAAQSIPGPGEAWAAAEVFYRLGIRPGDHIELGNTRFKLTRVVKLEMDAGGSVFRIAPRVIINLASLAATGLITPASRASYKLQIAGTETDMARLRLPLSNALGAAETLETVDQGRPEVSGALNRAVRFMKLASVLTILIAGAAVALAVSSYTRRETRYIAILKSLGATRPRLWKEYALRFIILLVSVTLLGSILGLLAQMFLAEILSGWLNVTLPALSLRPLISGLAAAALTLGGFALPSIIRVIQTPPMRVMRAEIERAPMQMWLTILSIGLAMGGFLVWQAGELKLAGIIFAGLLICLALMLLIAWLLTLSFRRFRVLRNQGWQLGLANIGRYGGRASLLIATIGIGIFALSLLGGVREDLISAWQNRIPDDAPNHFLINIQPDDLDSINTFFEHRQLANYQLYPLVRGRLYAINGVAVRADKFEDRQAKNATRRELNLTTAFTLPAANKIIAGQWFSPESLPANGQPERGISVEAEFAARIGVTLNDVLELNIGGKTFSAPITSLREVEWDTMQPNFYIIAAPGALDTYAMNYITAVKITSQDTQFTTDLVKTFPEVTVLDVRAILTQIQLIISQVSRAVEVVFAFSLLAGLVVLLAAIQTQRNDRRQEIAILKTLGASQKQIKYSVATEFMVLGALAGLTGSSFALLTGWVLAEQIFNLNYDISWLPVLWGVLAGIIGLGGVGYSVIRQLINTPPMHLMQEL